MAEDCGCWLGILDCVKLGCGAGLGCGVELGKNGAGCTCCCGWLGILDCAGLGCGSRLYKSGTGWLGILAALIG